MNSFGRVFKVSLFGASHGPCVGALIDGCPPGISLAPTDFEKDLSRRKSAAPGTTPRREPDAPIFLSGLFEGRSTGAPIAVMFENRDVSSKDYDRFKQVPRPGHADFAAMKKYRGFNDHRGGGMFSGRMTVALTAAGVVAKKTLPGIGFSAALIRAGGRSDIGAAVGEAMAEGDSVGGLIECRISNVPVGLGEPFFDSAESVISHMVFAIPAVKGIEFGAGFAAAAMKGSRHNDPLADPGGRTLANHAGGISGGISNGNDMVFRVAVKPTPSIARPQKTLDLSSGKMTRLEIKGRHDACAALRAPVVVEAAAAIALADLSLLFYSVSESRE
ncbi:Chorismate synthase [Candidatus Desulfarcum epimagneticum]|uniref:Chorismate synthase n=1 Tax=uncultured Desulfobacteraceae bacterium TaxID=218296 RepID=A0A484HDQ4_9BACT|nr:Chorismate synthase [uncultured Desulfobacteraceae bacterium]